MRQYCLAADRAGGPGPIECGLRIGAVGDGAGRARENRRRFERIEGTNEQLTAPVADVDDARAIQRDRDVAIGAVDRQRRLRDGRDQEPRHPSGRRSCGEPHTGQRTGHVSFLRDSSTSLSPAPQGHTHLQ